MNLWHRMTINLNHCAYKLMYLILIFEIVIVTCLIGYLIQSYSSKDVSIYVKGMALVSWLINFLLLLFLPFDIYITYRDESVG